MKICLVSNLFPPRIIGGAEIMASHVAQALRGAGHAVSVVTTAPRAETGSDVAGDLRLHRIGTGNLYWPGAAPAAPRAVKPLWHAIDLWNPVVYRRVREILREEQPDVVHTHNLGGLSAAVWSAARAERRPIVHTPHDYALTCVRAMRLTRAGRICERPCATCGIRGAWLRRLSETVTAVAAPSRFVLERHLELGFFRRAEIHIVPYALADAPAVVAGAGEGSLGVLVLGQLRAHKGIRVVLDALAMAPDVDLRLEIAGTGELLAACQAAAANDPRIRVHGFVAGPAKSALFARSHLLLCPSTWWDVSPVVILEAFARGLPVLASRIGGIPELVEDGQTGFLVEPGDAADLARRLRQLAGHRDLLRALSKAALARAEARRLEGMAAQLTAVYAGIVAQRDI